MQNLLYTAFGAVFFIAMGAVQIDDSTTDQDTKLAQGALSIIAGAVFVGDCGIQIYKIKQERY